jgi:hypothetical protein
MSWMMKGTRANVVVGRIAAAATLLFFVAAAFVAVAAIKAHYEEYQAKATAATTESVALPEDGTYPVVLPGDGMYQEVRLEAVQVPSERWEVITVIVARTPGSVTPVAIAVP